MLRRFAISDWKSKLQAYDWVATGLKGRFGMAALKRTEPKKAQDTPPRSCVVCTENEDSVSLIRPCRNCETDYCLDCLRYMFLEAATGDIEMPPRCCTLIQIHTVLGHLTHDQAKRYRTAFEEWITPTKTYCPSPTCSAFIPEKRVPTVLPKAWTHSLKSVLTEILIKVSASGSARFFRGEMDITELPGFTNVVKTHIDLSMIEGNIDRYRSTNDLTADLRLLVSNAKEYNGERHPVTDAANELFSTYVLELSKATDCLTKATASPAGPELFACPECHVAICSGCKQVEHTGKECDTSAADHETAMLATFGYKRCPRCKAGVKKMFGCSHMACICGAHWCYWCQKSTNECDGTCDERESDDYDDDDYDSEDDGHSDPQEVRVPESLPQVQFDIGSAESSTQKVATIPHDDVIVNLDAGGERRWADADYDFGDEPEEEPYSQIWSCHHTFRTYEAPLDGFNRGDLERMECNRCFEQVRAQKVVAQPTASSKKRQKNGPRPKGSVATHTVNPDGDNGQVAWECFRCRLVVCLKCRDRYSTAEGS